MLADALGTGHARDPQKKAKDEADLQRGINRFRWVEYSISATLMVLLIAAYSGITEITTVIAIAGRRSTSVPIGS